MLHRPSVRQRLGYQRLELVAGHLAVQADEGDRGGLGGQHHEAFHDLFGSDRVHPHGFAGVLGLHQHLIVA